MLSSTWCLPATTCSTVWEDVNAIHFLLFLILQEAESKNHEINFQNEESLSKEKFDEMQEKVIY